MSKARAVALGKRLWPIALVLWKERKAEVGIILGAAAIVREVAQALGH